MKFCQHCGASIADRAEICPHCGCRVSGHWNNSGAGADEVSVPLCILSFIIPPFGLIYRAVQSKATPRKAKACGMWALAS